MATGWKGRDVELEAIRQARPLIAELGHSIDIVGDGFCQLFLQERGCDIGVQHSISGKTLFVEIKGSAKTYQSLFIETIQHVDTGNDGWIHSLRSDLFMWVYIDTHIAYLMKVPALRRYYESHKDKLRYCRPEGLKTEGCLVPWDILLSEAGLGSRNIQRVNLNETDHYDQLLMLDL